MTPSSADCRDWPSLRCLRPLINSPAPPQLILMFPVEDSQDIALRSRAHARSKLTRLSTILLAVETQAIQAGSGALSATLTVGNSLETLSIEKNSSSYLPTYLYTVQYNLFVTALPPLPPVFVRCAVTCQPSQIYLRHQGCSGFDLTCPPVVALSHYSSTLLRCLCSYSSFAIVLISSPLRLCWTRLLHLRLPTYTLLLVSPIYTLAPLRTSSPSLLEPPVQAVWKEIEH
ncbi:uncharacterized protein BDV17DRAFT_108697 [Aspergillus undulatus]|uniref:uncharacterized protein n=1 Tax=Aspergillus undulatus TaxID=1810928 RepID=UPI003CCDE7FF